MNIEEKRARINYLTGLLDEALKAYEQEDREIMSNLEYDSLYDELLSLEKETGIVLANSPTHRVGYEILSELPKERHASAMLSLDKTKSRDTLKDWLGDKTGILSWKMDGLTIVLTYNKGELIKAVTRGNGEIGEVITNNARVFKNIPLKIPYTGEVVIRGEAVIRYSDFEKMNNEIEDVSARYKNPRNLCSGSVRQLDSRITAKRNVHLYAFSLIEGPETIETRHEQLDWLDKQGFTTVERSLVNSDNISDEIERFAKAVETNDFPSDGLVLTYDDIAYGKSLGRTAKFPRDAIAFKWADEQMETRLLEVEWSASRTGLINPVAIFEPVELEGTTVSRASLHNISIMEDMELGIGDIIKVYKANMIIPQVAENLTKSGNMPIPSECPVCKGKTEIKDENGVRSLYCTNQECAAKKIKKLALFTDRDAMNIDGMSEATIERLVDIGAVREIADFFRLDRYKEQIINMEGFGEKSYGNMLEAAKKASNTTLPRLIYSLGIPGIGVANAKLLCSSFDNSLEELKNATVERLIEISQIGNITAQAIADYFNTESNLSMLNNLLEYINIEKPEKSSTEASLAGLKFVITGSVEHFANRNELKAYIEERGGKTADSVSANTNYLINNDTTSNSSKNKKAKELGIRIISEVEFLEELCKTPIS